jgi:threonine dehydrogenase-like Zn-dependent dehydrogenase
MEVLANGLCGSDYWLYSGKLDPHHAPFPLIPGHEMVGRITAIDDEAALTWNVGEGDRVAVEPMWYCGQCADCLAGRPKFCRVSKAHSTAPISLEPSLWGGMGEYMVLTNQTRVHKVPDHVSDDDATMLNPFANVFEWARAAEIIVGETVLVMGLGQRGLACTAVAAESGASRVIVTGRTPTKLALARDFGATDVIDVSQEDVVQAVRSIVGPNGVDKVVDVVPGDTAPIGLAMQLLRNEGILVVAGDKASDAVINADLIHRKGLTIRGGFATTPWSSANAMRVIASGKYPLEKLPSRILALEEVEEAVKMLGGEVPRGDIIHFVVHPYLDGQGSGS